MTVTRSATCLCVFCGSSKKNIRASCPTCSRAPDNQIDLARSLLLSFPPVDVDGRTVGLEEDELEAVASAVRRGEVTWSEADINTALGVVRGFQEGSPWWSNIVIFGGFAASVVFLVWISWLFIRRLIEFLE